MLMSLTVLFIGKRFFFPPILKSESELRDILIADMQ